MAHPMTTTMHMRSIGLMFAVLFAQHGMAQPPIVVDWIQDGLPAYSTTNGLHVNPVSHSTLAVMEPSPSVSGCSTNRVAVWFSPSGELSDQCCDACMEVYGIAQMFSGAFITPTGCLIYATVDVGGSYGSTSVAGVYNYGPGWVEPITMYGGGQGLVGFMSSHALVASSTHVFIGGSTWNIAQDEYACPNNIWKYPYPDASNGNAWISCVDTTSAQRVKALELWNDTLLAVAFPKVTKIDTLYGTPMGSFNLFNGAPMDDGHTCIFGDTLFWASQFGGSQLHVGKYLINSGPIWEVTLPFAGVPAELHHDGMGRLWTAAGNKVIWIDQADGSYQSYPMGLSVVAMAMVGTAVAICGTTDGATSYVLHGHVVP